MEEGIYETTNCREAEEECNMLYMLIQVRPGKERTWSPGAAAMVVMQCRWISA